MNDIEQTHTKHQKYQWGLWCTFSYVYIYICIHTHAYTHTNCIYICMHIDIYIDTYIYIYIYINICIPGSTRPRWGRSLNHIKCAFGKGCWQQCLILLMTKGMTDCMNGRIGPWKNGWVTKGSRTGWAFSSLLLWRNSSLLWARSFLKQLFWELPLSQGTLSRQLFSEHYLFGNLKNGKMAYLSCKVQHPRKLTIFGPYCS